ncbi:sugar ABC transporter ATP-binding protein [Brevibacillus sp. B_LB10_24]|uniref:sugar ABC transporter ATP-binding protein n=1 Tax=Brevibacillus sp. B_LB10_24 TaxID=3380645 RepID=UPI0038B818EC
MESSHPLLEVRNIRKVYHNQVALKDVCLSLNKGEILALLGKNGAGKSTLTNIISGAIPADSGDIYIDGQKVTIQNPQEAIKHGISVIYQELHLFDNLTVAENLFFHQYPMKRFSTIDWPALYRHTQTLCDSYGYALDVRKKVRELGRGDQQLVAILKTMSQNTKIIIMDEPTNSLSELDVQKLFHTLRQIKKEGISVIFITHNIQDMYQIADRVAIINDGEIAKVITSTDEIGSHDILHAMAGKNFKRRYPKLPVPKQSEILRVKGLHHQGIIKDISFTLHRGEIIGIAGLVGSGRTTLLKTLFGANGPYEGSVQIKGRQVDLSTPQDAVKHGIAFVPEDRNLSGLIPKLDIIGNTSISHLQGVENEVLRFLIDKKYESNRIHTYLRKLAVKWFSPRQPIRQLSGGNQQKVLLARWLFSNSDIFLLDEPTKSIDIPSKVEVFNIMNELVRNGKGIIFISSDLSEIVGMCDRILVMHNGMIVKELDGSIATNEQIIYFASGGT